MIYFIIIKLIIYSLWLLTMLIAWHRIKPMQQKSVVSYKLSVIVPFRNEEDNLPVLIRSFNKLNLDNLSVEFLFVNDHSSDGFQKIFESVQSDYQLLSLPNGLSGKKAALAYGLEHASGDIIVTTDADCEVRVKWLEIIHNYFQDSKLNMVFGGVSYKTNSFFDKLQMIEFAPLIGTGAASLQLGQPFMCNGANLAFRKTAFNSVNGYAGNEHIASGDDEFLLAKINNQLQGKIRYMKESDAVVLTNGAKDIKAFFSQRKRWSSKWNQNLSVYKVFIAMLVLLTALSTLIGLAHLLLHFNVFLMLVLIVKIFLEGVFISSILHHLNSSFNIFYYLLVQLVYPLYVLIFGAVANFGQYRWKGRIH